MDIIFTVIGAVMIVWFLLGSLLTAIKIIWPFINFSIFFGKKRLIIYSGAAVFFCKALFMGFQNQFEIISKFINKLFYFQHNLIDGLDSMFFFIAIIVGIKIYFQFKNQREEIICLKAKIKVIRKNILSKLTEMDNDKKTKNHYQL